MKRRMRKLLLFAFAILAANSLAFAGDIGKFTSVENKVDVLKSGQAEAKPVIEGDVVAVGDIVRTKSRSRTEITFADNTILRLAENSRVEIKEYQVDEKGKRINAVINVERGKIRAIVSKTNGKTDFTINTPNASGSVKGTDIVVFYQKSSTGVVVIDGKLSVVNSTFPDKVVEVSSGNTSVISADQPPQEARAYLAMEKERHETDTRPAVKQEVAKAEKAPLVAEGYTEPGQMNATVVKVAGGVRVRSRGAITWHDAKINEILGAGDEIETKDDGKIEIKIDNGNVINLKQNTKFKLQKLTQNLQTGDYENLLECNIGKIRAQVEKIKGNSKFEIKTPTAVAAVKGTVLFLNVLPNLTNAYFQGGNGTLNNIISGITQVVSDGNSSSADNQGNTSEPAPPSDAEKSQWTEGWEAEGGGEGYTPPGGGEGGEGEGEGGGEEGGGGGGPDLGGGGGGTDGSPFDDVPITDTTGLGDGGGEGDGETGEEGETPTVVNLSGSGSGNFGYFGSFEIDEESSLDAALSTTTTSAPWEGVLVDPETNAKYSPATLTGTYSNPTPQKLWWGDVIGTGDDGGAFEGWVGGSWHSWEGVVSSIYIDPSGMAGNLFGYMSGTNDASTLSGGGDLFVIPIAETDVPPELLSISLVPGSGSGNLYVALDDSAGYLDAEFDRQMMKIDGEDWGIWREIYSGTYDRPDDLSIDPDDGLAHWIGTAGGDYISGDNMGYFFSAFEGIDNLDDLLRIDVFGAYLDYEKLGGYYGTILGAYTPSNPYDFEGVGLGGFEEETLTFSGYWGGGSLYNDSGLGYLEEIGGEYGLIGSTTPQWWNATPSFAVLAMGEYYIDDETALEPFIWNTYIYSDYVTQDGGAFSGVTAGIWNNEIMDGAVAALYMDPSGNAGVLRGDVSGNYYPSLEMWMAEGNLSPTQMAQAADLGISPQDFLPDDYISEGYLDGEFSGGFAVGGFAEGEGEGEDGNYIEGETAWGNTYFIDDGTTAQPWGIYDLKLQGPDSPDSGYDNPENSTIWMAEIYGFEEYGGGKFGPAEGEWIGITGGSWLNGEIRGALAGLYVRADNMAGLIRGDVFGIYDETGNTWIGESIGVFNEMGAFDPDSEPIESEFFGTGLGSFVSGGTLEVVSIEGMALGILDIISKQNWGIWAAYLDGTYTEPTSPFTLAMGGTHDGFEGTDGYWLGTLNGDWENGILDGDFKGVWFGLEEFDQTFNVGSVTGDVNGTYVDTTWEAVGVGEWVELAELNPDILGFDNVALAAMVDVPITETYASLIQGAGGFDVVGGGTLTGAMDISFYTSASAIDNIWAALISGNYTGPTSDSWTLPLSDGNGTSATLAGTEWDNGQWLANVTDGVAPNGVTFDGQAGGTYTGTDAGTFTGVGAGTWETPAP